MVRQKDRDASSKFSTIKVTHIWNSSMPAVLSLTSKSENKEQAHSWVGDHRDAVENVVSLLMLIRSSGIAKSTALFFESWEKSLTSKYTSL